MPEKPALPSYEKPPVSEVVVGVEFAPLASWNLSHYGLLLRDFESEFPKFQTQPALLSQLEDFGPDFFAPKTLSLQFVTEPTDVRCWYASEDGNWLIQVQRDRFIVNWRRANAGDVYPRYEPVVRPTFERLWTKFRTFLVQHGIAEVEVRQAEVTYVNDIAKGDGWEQIGDLSRVIAPWSGRSSEDFLPPPETVRISSSYRMPSDTGRLHLVLQHVRRVSDEREVLQLRLTARGVPRDSTTPSVLEWIDLGREWIVRGFTDVTTHEAQTQTWGRHVH